MPKTNLKNVKHSSVFRTKDFVPHRCKQNSLQNVMLKK